MSLRKGFGLCAPNGWQTFCGKDNVQRLNNCKRWACQDVYVCPSHHFGTHAIIGIDLIGGIRLVEMRKADGAGERAVSWVCAERCEVYAATCS